MEINYIKKASDFLGEENSRYFSNGFKYVNYKYFTTIISGGEIKGKVKIGTKNPNSTFQKYHIGSIEYIAIACNLCEQMIREEYNLTEEEISISWIRSCKMKIKKCIYISEKTVIKVCANIIKTQSEKNSLNGYVSSLEIHIEDILIKMEIDHPIKIWFKLLSFERTINNISELYNEGYKKEVM